jgi:L-histidine Nalpha-methyltransferase / hercynylcysteine S-oxide synthase
MNCSLSPSSYAKQPVPSLDEFKELWQTWDLISLKMLPKDELLNKPIYLRNCCLFYLGHIPNFLDIHLTRTTGEGLTEPSKYREIFERGIDPDVDNPEKCHAHSQIPDSWPSFDEILKYQQAVRDRVAKLYTNGGVENSEVGKALWIGFEHEGIE